MTFIGELLKSNWCDSKWSNNEDRVPSPGVDDKEKAEYGKALPINIKSKNDLHLYRARMVR